MKGFKITSGAMWALFGMLLAGMFVTHKISGMLAFTPASQTAVARERTAVNTSDVSELAAPASCDPYVAESIRIRLARETPVAMVLQAAHEGLTATQADNYLNARRSASTGAARLPPPPVVTGQTWATTNSDGLGATWRRPTRELGGYQVVFLGLDEFVQRNAGRVSVRRHDRFTVDLPATTAKPLNNAWTTWSIAPALDVNTHPRTPDTTRYIVDVTTGGTVNPSYHSTGDVVLAQLFTTTPPNVPNGIPGISVVNRRVSWKIYAMAGNIVIPRTGYHRPIQRSCEVIPRVNSTIASEDRAAIAGLISELDGVDSDPAAPSDLQAMVAVAKHNVTDALQRRLTPDQNAIDAANARADYYRGLYVAYWNFFEVRVPAQITELENVLIGSNGIVLLLALVFTMITLDLRRKLSKLPPAPPSESMIANIRYEFLASMETELFQLVAFVRSYIGKDHEDYSWINGLTQGTLISSLVGDPSRLLRVARLLAESEIRRLGPRHTPAEPMPAAKAGRSIDNTFATAIEELCLAITDAAGVARPTAKMDLVWLVARAAGSVPHALDKAAKAALAAHACPTAETPSGEHRAAKTGAFKGTDLVETLCRRIITKFAGESIDGNPPLNDLVTMATAALNRAIKKAFDDGAASRNKAIEHYEEENRKAADLITALQEAHDILKEEFAAVFKSFFPSEELVCNSAGYVEKAFDASHRMEKALEALRTGTTGSVALDVAISALRWLRDNNSKGPKQRMAHIKRGLGETMSVAEATGATREDQPQTRPLGAVYVEAATEASNPEKVENDKDAADVVVAAKEIDLSNPGAVVTDEPGNGRDRSGARLSQSSPATPSTEVSSSS